MNQSAVITGADVRAFFLAQAEKLIPLVGKQNVTLSVHHIGFAGGVIESEPVFAVQIGSGQAATGPDFDTVLNAALAGLQPVAALNATAADLRAQADALDAKARELAAASEAATPPVVAIPVEVTAPVEPVAPPAVSVYASEPARAS